MSETRSNILELQTSSNNAVSLLKLLMHLKYPNEQILTFFIEKYMHTENEIAARFAVVLFVMNFSGISLLKLMQLQMEKQRDLTYDFIMV